MHSNELAGDKRTFQTFQTRFHGLGLSECEAVARSRQPHTPLRSQVLQRREGHSRVGLSHRRRRKGQSRRQEAVAQQGQRLGHGVAAAQRVELRQVGGRAPGARWEGLQCRQGSTS